MPITLPPSLDKRLHPVEEEVADARSLTPEQQLEIVAKVCRASLQILKMHPKRERILELRDPLPESTIRALRRLRAQL